MPYSNERLGELLVRAGLIDEPALEMALRLQERSGGKLGEVLVAELVLTEDAIALALAEQKGLRHINLTSFPVDRTVATMLPLRMVRRREIIPIAISGETVVLAMADPLDVEAIDETELLTAMKVEPVVAAASQVRYAIEKYIAGAGALLELELVSHTTEVDDDPADGGGDADVAVVRIVNQLIKEAVADRASDIHFEPAEKGVRVRYRVDGVLREAAGLPRSSQSELLSRIKVMADLDITERRRSQDGRFGIRVDGNALDVRVATMPTQYGEAITLRILDSEVAFRPLEQIGLAQQELTVVRRMLSQPFGALFVSGPTGSGKSTTLYSLLSTVNSPGRKVITVEDPVEYRIDGVTQMTVNNRVGMTFAAGLRTILRSDPDIIMVGEVRDAETAEIAVRAALTGHLVLTSIHTNDAPSALTRLTDMGIPPYITSAGLVGAIAQRLVRVLCPECKECERLSWDSLVAAGFGEDEAMSVDVYVPRGCDQCGQTGYRGRIGCFEVMEFTPELHDVFLRTSSSLELRETALAHGMRPLRRDALDKVAAGITSLAELNRVVI